jgi:hypothetical protein
MVLSPRWVTIGEASHVSIAALPVHSYEQTGSTIAAGPLWLV